MQQENYLTKKIKHISCEISILEDNYNYSKEQFYMLLRLQQRLSRICELGQTEIELEDE